MTFRERYIEKIRLRWHGEYRRDALDNYRRWTEHRANIEAALKMREAGIRGYDKGNLRDMVFHMQWHFEKDHHALYPFLDFNEDSQTIFPARGIIQFCELLLEGEFAPDADPHQEKLCLPS